MNIVSQHAEEAVMLSLLRRTATNEPHYSLAELVKLDGRVEAYLDGLRIAGEEGLKICDEHLATNEEGEDEVFAVGVMVFESARPEFIAKVFSIVEEEPKTVDGLVPHWSGFRLSRRCRTFKICFGVTSRFINAWELPLPRFIGGIRGKRWGGSFGRRIRRCGRGRLDL